MSSTVVYTFAQGQTTVLKLFPDGSDSPANGAGDTGVAATNRKWLYTATVAETLSGLHRAAIEVAGQAVAEGWVNMVDGAANEVKESRSEAVGYSLAATGLDAIASPDSLTPGVVPSTFTQWFRWLIQRFIRADKSGSAITVKNTAGQTITSQAITSVGDDETLGAPS